MPSGHFAGLETCDTAGLEACATSPFPNFRLAPAPSFAILAALPRRVGMELLFCSAVGADVMMTMLFGAHSTGSGRARRARPEPVEWAALLLVLAALMLTTSEAPAGTRSTGSGQAKKKKADPVLILHDSAGPFGWIGGVHARMLANLLGHFDLPYRVWPVEQYQPGTLSGARAVFYLGTSYDNALPPAFLRDVAVATQSVCWFKYNLWQWQAASADEFGVRHGFRFDLLDSSGFGDVRYKGEVFEKNALDAELGRTTVLDANVASVMAWACRPGTYECIPYAIRGGNLWYIADTPFSFLAEEDRYVVFCDLLHDILGLDHAESHRALVRLEDIDPRTSPASLRGLVETLRAEEVPFLLSVIPVHADPLGYYNGGVPRTLTLRQTPELVDVLKQAVAAGGQVVLHGYTHQYAAVPNPYNGLSGDDFEFFRVTLDGAGGLERFAPVPEDSYRWAQTRALTAVRELKRAGFGLAAWSTPHYAASAIDYVAFADLFPLTLQRAIYFADSGNVTGVTGRGRDWRERFPSGPRFGGQFFPYVIQTDIYGQKIVPENLGNVDLPVLNGTSTRSPSDLVRIAQKNLVVRDGWASGFFHPFLDPALLQELVRGIKNEGYTFVPLTPGVR